MPDYFGGFITYYSRAYLWGHVDRCSYEGGGVVLPLGIRCQETSEAKVGQLPGCCFSLLNVTPHRHPEDVVWLEVPVQHRVGSL